MMKKFTLIILATAMLAGCTTLPVATQINNMRSYSTSKDAIWTKLVEFLATSNIQIKTIEKDSGIIYAEPSNSDPTFSDCGSDAFSIPMSNPASLNIFVSDAGGPTRVTINTSFKEIRRMDTFVNTVDCVSTGILEAAILNALT